MRRFPSMSMVRHLLTKTAGALMPERSRPGSLWSDKRGNVALMTAALAVPVIGVSALAVDVGAWEVSKSGMQGAADQAALAAGLAMSAGTGAAQQEAKGVAAAHGFVDGAGGVRVAVNIPPTAGSYANSAGAVEVVITQPQQGFLSGVVLSAAPTASAKAVAAPGAAAGKAATCIMALATTGPGLAVSNAGQLEMKNCNIYVNSNSNCSMSLINAAGVKAVDIFLGSAAVCTENVANVKGTLHPNASAEKDPYLGREMPSPASKCTPPVLGNNVSKNTLKPGTYCNLIVDNARTVQLEPGLYVIAGGNVAVSGTSKVTGTGVTLLLTNKDSSYGGLTVSNSAILDLTPMTEGHTRGMAIWLDQNGRKNVDFGNSSNVKITGAIYAPGSSAAWSNASSNSGSPCTQLIAKTISISGASSFGHDCTGLNIEDVGSVGTGGYKLKE